MVFIFNLWLPKLIPFSNEVLEWEFLLLLTPPTVCFHKDSNSSQPSWLKNEAFIFTHRRLTNWSNVPDTNTYIKPPTYKGLQSSTLAWYLAFKVYSLFCFNLNYYFNLHCFASSKVSPCLSLMSNFSSANEMN